MTYFNLFILCILNEDNTDIFHFLYFKMKMFYSIYKVVNVY